MTVRLTSHPAISTFILSLFRVMACSGCTVSEVHLIHTCLYSDERALKIFEEHGVIPCKQSCGRCGREWTLGADKSGFRCYKRSRLDPNSQKEVRCDFYAARFKDTWLNHVKLPSRISLLFINDFLRKSFTQEHFKHKQGTADRHFLVFWHNDNVFLS